MKKQRGMWKRFYVTGMIIAAALGTCAYSEASYAEELNQEQVADELTDLSEEDVDVNGQVEDFQMDLYGCSFEDEAVLLTNQLTDDSTDNTTGDLTENLTNDLTDDIIDDLTDDTEEDLTPGWYETEEGMQYLDENLEYVTGWQEIEGAKYYFNEDGIMQTGLQQIEGKTYLFTESGVMRTGWRRVGDHRYYFHKTGDAATGWMEKKGDWYYMNADGEVQLGWQLIKDRYYFFTNSGKMKTGWLRYKNRWYYLDENGRMKTGWLQYNNRWYYLDANGRMKTGWLQHRGSWYYLESDGKMKTGWLENRKHWYFFGADGVMLTSQRKTLAGKTYYFDDQGIMLSGKVIEDGDSLYYIQNDGSIRTTEGWFKENDKVYLVGKDGKLTINKLAKYDGTYYYLRPTGIGELLRNQTAARIADSLGCDLKAAMKYAGGLKYAGKDYFTNSWGTKKLANYGFANRSGNCYVYAATLTELAYAMGYDAHQVRGCIRLSWGWGNNHSWVEIYKDGKTYVCDPAGLNQLGMDHAYMFHYGDKGTWMYKDQFEIIYE